MCLEILYLDFQDKFLDFLEISKALEIQHANNEVQYEVQFSSYASNSR